MAKKLIVFDFDGTIMHTHTTMSLSIIGVLEFYNRHVPSLKEMNDLLGNLSMANIFRKYAKHDLLDIEIETMIAKYYEIYGSSLFMIHSYFFDGILELIKKIRSIDNVKLAILSNKKSTLLTTMVDYYNLHHYFDYIYGAEDVDQMKPHPSGLLRLMNNCNVDHKNTLLIGDSLADLKAALNVKCHFLLVNWEPEYQKHKETIANLKPLVVQTIDELEIEISQFLR